MKQCCNPNGGCQAYGFNGGRWMFFLMIAIGFAMMITSGIQSIDAEVMTESAFNELGNEQDNKLSLVGDLVNDDLSATSTGAEHAVKINAGFNTELLQDTAGDVILNDEAAVEGDLLTYGENHNQADMNAENEELKELAKKEAEAAKQNADPVDQATESEKAKLEREMINEIRELNGLEPLPEPTDQVTNDQVTNDQVTNDQVTNDEVNKDSPKDNPAREGSTQEGSTTEGSTTQGSTKLTEGSIVATTELSPTEGPTTNDPATDDQVSTEQTRSKISKNGLDKTDHGKDTDEPFAPSEGEKWVRVDADGNKIDPTVGNVGAGLVGVGAVFGSTMHTIRKVQQHSKANPDARDEEGNKVDRVEGYVYKSFGRKKRIATNWVSTFLIVIAVALFMSTTVCIDPGLGMNKLMSAGIRTYASLALVGLGCFVHFNQLDFGTMSEYENKETGEKFTTTCNLFGAIPTWLKTGSSKKNKDFNKALETDYEKGVNQPYLRNYTKVGRSASHGTVELADIGTTLNSKRRRCFQPFNGRSASQEILESRRRLANNKTSPLMQALLAEIKLAKCKADA